MKHLMRVVAVLAATGCNATITPDTDCEVACEDDNDCSGDQVCGDAGLCTSGAICEPPMTAPDTCTPGAFLGCDDADTIRLCELDGVTHAVGSCGGLGCNAEAERCNQCVAGEATCNEDNVETCGADGVVASTESCTLGCTIFGARCQTIAPEFLPDVCDAPAPTAGLVITVPITLDTGVDAICNGGVIAQSSGPEICVIRYGSIALSAPVTVIGPRAIAFVADGALEVTNLLDVSATLGRNGPGGGRRNTGEPAGAGGGGGAGSKQIGGNGGGTGVGSNAGSGGGTFDPQITKVFEGGARPGSAFCAVGEYCPLGGGGGGALQLVSCTGTVSMSGLIDAGGGGGAGGGDRLKSASTAFLGGSGGGAGGYVVIQGANVVVTGGVFANGGGGGGGCGVNNCVGASGQDGAVNGIGGLGGIGMGDGLGSSGGRGGLSNNAPGNAEGSGFSPGGGGGSTGRIQIYTPAGVTPTLGGAMQPPPEPNRNVNVR